MTAYAGTLRSSSIVRATRSGALRAAARVANDLDRYRIYVGVDGEPDFDTPTATADSLPASVDLDAGHTYRVVVREVNAYGLESVNIASDEYTVESFGALSETPPSDAQEAELTAIAGGSVRLEAEYRYLDDAGDAADTWIYYLTTDGSDPDPDIDIPTEVTMRTIDGLAKLRVDFGPYATGTTVKALVRTRRSGTPDVDSTSTTILSATADDTAPANPDATASADAAALDT